MRWRLAAAGVAVCLVTTSGAAVASSSVGAEGSLDTSFGLDGRVLDFASAYGFTHDAVVQPDGKLLVVGGDPGSGSRWFVARYTTSGALDQSFGDNGMVNPTVGDVVAGGRVEAITLQPDGKILTAGSGPLNGSGAVALVRMLSDGSLDPTFGGGDGIALDDIAPNFDTAYSVAVQKDGRIVVGGISTTADPDELVLRYTSTGSLDGSFGIGGVANINRNVSERIDDIAIQPDGKIVSVGYSGDGSAKQMSVMRFTTGGDLESGATFAGNAGTYDLSFGDEEGLGVTLDKAGGILIAGFVTWANQDGFLMRLNPDGNADGNFGVSGGVINLDGSSLSAADSFRDLAIARDGKIVAVGSTTTDAGTKKADAWAVRFSSTGAPDSAFGAGGRVVIDFGNTNDYANAVAIDTKGRILLAGADTEDAALARLVGDGTPPARAKLATLPRWSLAKRVVHWSGTDDNSGVASYDVARQFVKYSSSSYSPADLFLSKRTSTRTTVTARPGYTYCYAARARDRAGNVGNFTDPSVCTAWPVDDRGLTRHGSWTAGKGRAFYRGSFLRSSVAGSSLTLGVRYRHLALVARTCSTCGTVKVFRGSTLLKKVSLHAASTHNRVVIPIAAASSLKSGTIRIVQASGGKPVTVDGLAVSFR